MKGDREMMSDEDDGLKEGNKNGESRESTLEHRQEMNVSSFIQFENIIYQAPTTLQTLLWMLGVDMNQTNILVSWSICSS